MWCESGRACRGEPRKNPTPQAFGLGGQVHGDYEKPELRRCAAMGAWNGTWFDNDPEYTKFLTTTSSDVDIEVEELLKLMCVKGLVSMF